MFSLVNNNFNRTYNPSGRQNALSDIKRLLTARDTEAQNKACGYLIEVISRYNKNSAEGSRLIEYLLDNDITVFLCEATSNLDFSLFRSILSCVRLLWRDRRFFAEEHGAHALTAALRALAHYASTSENTAVAACLHFMYDLFMNISTFETTPALSHQSAYSTPQLLACLNSLAPRINTNPNIILSSALVLHSLLSYQPEGLTIRGSTALILREVIKQWFQLLMGALNHSMLVGDEVMGMFLGVLCQLGIQVLRLIKLLQHGNQKVDFVNAILTDEQEIARLNQSAFELSNAIQKVMSELITFVKENQTQISTDEYSVFLNFLLSFLHDTQNSEVLVDFCDVLFSKGYISMLPQVQIVRDDITVRKASTLVLGEMLKVLAEKYLNVDSDLDDRTCARDIHMGLVELQYGIEKPQSIGQQLQKSKPYSLLIYIYFYCQSSDNPEEATAPLLPFLVEHILRLPKSFVPPSYIIKALWLVFAMSTISNGSVGSLKERIYLEKATDSLVRLLQPNPSVYYTHNPALLLWAFTSLRITHHVKIHVLSQWLKLENSLPEDLSTEPVVWELLLNILSQSKDCEISSNCMEALHVCLENGDDDTKQEFAVMLWTSIPTALSRALIDYDSEIDKNICYLLDIATTLVPSELDQTVCLKIAVLITTIFSKNVENSTESESRYHYEYVILKLSLYLLGLANNQNDNRVLLTYTARPAYLTMVLTSTHSADDRVACAALQLLSYIVHYFVKNNYQPKLILQIQSQLVIKSLRRDSCSERGASLLQLVYLVLSSGQSAPLALSYELSVDPSVTQQCNALRALMFRIQLMLCCRESENQSLAGWKTLSAIFKHAIVSKNDPKLIATLTSQPWTHTLIQFQLTQKITEEFLTFTHNWLSLLKITIQKNQEEKRSNFSKKSFVVRTLLMLKKKLVGDLDEVGQKTLVIAGEIIQCSGIVQNYSGTTFDSMQYFPKDEKSYSTEDRIRAPFLNRNERGKLTMDINLFISMHSL